MYKGERAPTEIVRDFESYFATAYSTEGELMLNKINRHWLNRLGY